MTRFCFEKDEDSHWYLIPVGNKTRFGELMTLACANDLPDHLQTEWDEVFEPRRIGGSLYAYSFTDPRDDL